MGVFAFSILLGRSAESISDLAIWCGLFLLKIGGEFCFFGERFWREQQIILSGFL
jgi:hypothetical protein